MYLGGQSKYLRCKNTSSACNHLAYIPSVLSLSYFMKYTCSLTFLLASAIHSGRIQATLRPRRVEPSPNSSQTRANACNSLACCHSPELPRSLRERIPFFVHRWSQPSPLPKNYDIFGRLPGTVNIVSHYTVQIVTLIRALISASRCSRLSHTRRASHIPDVPIISRPYRFITYRDFFRMLIATLKNMGEYPCASCETPLKYIHMLGTTADGQRRAHKRIDNEDKQDKIENARRWIFESGYRVDSSRVKECLGPHSLIPTRVSCKLSGFALKLLTVSLSRMLSHLSRNTVLIFTTCSRRISCMNSNSVYGRESSYTSFEYSMPKVGTQYRLSILGESFFVSLMSLSPRNR